METIEVEIVNKKAKKILLGLADLNLINIKEKLPKKNLQDLLNGLRTSEVTPSLEEITKEVELVRAKRYDSKG